MIENPHKNFSGKHQPALGPISSNSRSRTGQEVRKFSIFLRNDFQRRKRRHNARVCQTGPPVKSIEPLLLGSLITLAYTHQVHALHKEKLFLADNAPDILFPKEHKNQAVPVCRCYQRRTCRFRIGARDCQLIQRALLVLVEVAAAVAAHSLKQNSKFQIASPQTRRYEEDGSCQLTLLSKFQSHTDTTVARVSFIGRVEGIRIRDTFNRLETIRLDATFFQNLTHSLSAFC